MSIYLKESIRIADDLIDKLFIKDNQAYWKNLNYDIDYDGGGKFTWQEGESIYSGNSGILLFFIELFKETNDYKYAKIINKVLNWLEKNSFESTNNFSLYTGRLSSAFVFLKWYQLTNESKWLELAENCTINAESFLKTGLEDLMLGLSGSIIFFIHLFDETNKDRYLYLIDLYINKLIHNSKIGAKGGLFWNSNQGQIRGLCGLSHGCSGIGLTFLEVAHYFDIQAMQWLGDEAFNYENAYFDSNANNWPDFRQDAVRKSDQLKRKSAIIENNHQFFYLPNFMNAWCHGAAGIGIARQRAFQLFGSNSYKKDYLVALLHNIDKNNYTTNFNSQTIVLCHGFAGNADIHINHRIQKEKYDMKSIEDIAKTIIEKRSQGHKYRSGFYYSEEEDVSLFMGNAGIGYFFLRLHNPNISSVLTFNIPKRKKDPPKLSNYPNLSKTKNQIQWQILRKRFPRTIKFVEDLKLSDKFYNCDYSKFKNYIEVESLFMNQIEKLMSSHPGFKTKLELKDVYFLERDKVKVEQQDVSHSYLSSIAELTKSQLSVEGVLNFSHEEILCLDIQAHPYYMYHICNFNWSHFHPDLKQSTIIDEKTYYILIPSLYGVLEYPVSKIVVTILEDCRLRTNLKNFVDSFLKYFEINNNNDEKNAKNLILDKLKELHKHGLILFIPV